MHAELLVLILQENICIDQSAQASLPNPQNLCQAIKEACSLLTSSPVSACLCVLSKGSYQVGMHIYLKVILLMQDAVNPPSLSQGCRMQMAFGSVLKVNRIHRTARNILQYLLNNHRTGQAITRELVIRQAAFSSKRHLQRPATSTYMSWLYRSRNAASACVFL